MPEVFPNSRTRKSTTIIRDPFYIDMELNDRSFDVIIFQRKRERERENVMRMKYREIKWRGKKREKLEACI